MNLATSGPSTTKPWHVATIIAIILMMVLSALPNFFTGEPVIYLRAQSAELTRSLAVSDQFKPRSDESSLNGRRLMFDSVQHQLSYSEALRNAGVEQSDITLTVESTVPQWLNLLSVDPIKLGLDLRGGVLFILDVDTQKALDSYHDTVRLQLKSLLREFNLRGSSVSVNQSGLDITLRSGMDKMDELRRSVREIVGIEAQLNQNNNSLQVRFSDTQVKSYQQMIMAQSVETIRDRVEELGITEASVQQQGKQRIRIEIPGIQDPAEARRIIGTTAALDFYQVLNGSGKSYRLDDGRKVFVNPLPLLSGKNIVDAQAGRDEYGMPQVTLKLDNQGGDIMSDFSRKNIGKPMAAVYSEYREDHLGNLSKSSKVISYATIRDAFSNRFTISNLDSPQAANELALFLRAGSLDAPVKVLRQKTIGPTLGETNIEKGAAALYSGLAFTLLFMLLWYRKLGAIAGVALTLNLICLLGLMSLLPGAVLTLPGIAGLLLTVGMAVDTNVLIFERIKEEMKKGRSEWLSVHKGFKQAITTILDANITTMITAIILLGIGQGPVKGFAITLLLGLVTSMFTGVMVSKILCQSLSNKAVLKEKLS